MPFAGARAAVDGSTSGELVEFDQIARDAAHTAMTAKALTSIFAIQRRWVAPERRVSHSAAAQLWSEPLRRCSVARRSRKLRRFGWP